ncbi:hypothetical protein K435DRAFT_837045 [Dendrothele bispora CBS 962.96]|uniref:DUF6534 domain-containing protein n=1 Tax=Dendrothele bispora (strain CBS 962.96) TaxID=1314807 RepID=A0A4S8ME84_DENBC|nr:hypothetical protein K435DRAFT_837045 [Dendrothele bispora CBS 962.96]
MSPFPDRPTPISQKEYAASFGNNVFGFPKVQMANDVYMLLCDLGGTLICGLIAMLLYGISILQTYMYFLNYPRDAKWMKILFHLMLSKVTVIATLTTVQTTFHLSVLGLGWWGIYVGALLNYIIIILVQTFFAKMIYHLTAGVKRYFLMVGFATFILSGFSNVFFNSIYARLLRANFHAFSTRDLFQSATIEDFIPWIPKLLVPLRMLRMISDATTTLSLCLILFDANVQFKPSIKLVRTIIIYAINRLALTTIVGTVQTIMMIVNPHDISSLSIDYIAAHLYINSFLASLNARNSLRGGNPVLSYNVPGTQASALEFGHRQTATVTLPLVRLDEKLRDSALNKGWR